LGEIYKCGFGIWGELGLEFGQNKKKLVSAQKSKGKTEFLNTILSLNHNLEYSFNFIVYVLNKEVTGHIKSE
jgi:hypothetical protein